MSMSRIERDSMGEIEVPSDRLWGASTERSLRNFRIGTERIPGAVIRALALVKKASAAVNLDLGILDAEKARAIGRAADEVLEGKHEEEFPLVVWQTG
ncbi:MAG TPA: lyase family protein, partial [Vicinamibacteria bacterium]